MSLRARLCALGLLLAAAGTASASLSDRDRAAITTVETSVVPLPGPVGSKEPAPLAQRLAETKVPAISIAFIETDKVKWARAYGRAVADGPRLVTPTTRFQAASMSKAVATFAALQMVDAGRLSLDQDVNERLQSWRAPVFGAGAERVTLRRLLSHTAGLTVSGYPGYARGRPIPTAVQSLTGAPPANTAAVRAFAAPGAQFAYSGGGFTAAQLLMTEASGAEFAALMQAQLLRPAGMRRSTFAQGLPMDAASGHGADGTPLPGGAHSHPEQAAAGLWTTPSDYGRFLIAVQAAVDGRPQALLSRHIAREMITPVLADFGLGVRVLRQDDRTRITHGGSNAGFRCQFTAFLDGRHEGLVIMTNGDGGGALAAAVQRTIARAYGWADLSTPPPNRAPN